jgi:hypothetical protein
MQARRGDIFLTRGSGFVDSAIRYVEKKKLGPSPAKWNHAGVVTSDLGTTIEMQAKGAVIGSLSKYADYVILPIQLTDDQRDEIVAYAVEVYKRPTKYGWLTDLSIALDILTPSNLELRQKDTLICSQLAALCLFHAGVDVPEVDFGQVTPADLASWFVK